MKLVRVIDTKRCMGCRSCVAACAVENHFTPGAPWNVMIESEQGTYPNLYRTAVDDLEIALQGTGDNHVEAIGTQVDGGQGLRGAGFGNEGVVRHDRSRWLNRGGW